MYKDLPGTGEAHPEIPPPEHVAYRTALGEKVVSAGPLLSPDGGTSVGSMIIFEADDHAAAQSFAVGDPLVREGALELVSVTAHTHRRLQPAPEGRGTKVVIGADEYRLFGGWCARCR